MSEVEDGLDDALAEAEDFLPSTIIIAGQSYPCVLTDLQFDRDDTNPGPYREGVTGQLRLRKSVFPAMPPDETRVIVNGKSRRISGIDEDIASWNLGIAA